MPVRQSQERDRAVAKSKGRGFVGTVILYAGGAVAIFLGICALIDAISPGNGTLLREGVWDIIVGLFNK